MKNVSKQCNSILQYYCFYCIFDQIDAALKAKNKRQLLKTFKNLTDLKAQSFEC